MSEWINPMKGIVERIKALKEKRLLHACVWDAALERGCALGACMPSKVRAEWTELGCGGSLVSVIHPIYQEDIDSPVFTDWVRGIGITADVVRRIEAINDIDDEESEEARYTRVLAELTAVSEMTLSEYYEWAGEEKDEEC